MQGSELKVDVVDRIVRVWGLGVGFWSLECGVLGLGFGDWGVYRATRQQVESF